MLNTQRVTYKRAPQAISWFIRPMKSYRHITNKNHRQIGVMFTKLAKKLGHHLLYQISCLSSVQKLCWLMIV